MGTRRLVWSGALALAATLTMAAPALAATTDYPPDVNGSSDIRDFDDSAGGWTATVDREPLTADLLCVLQPLTCPTATNFWSPTGGADGATDGYLRTEISGLANVLTRTKVTWRSPAFTYTGAEGAVPDDVFLTLDRRTDAEALIQVLEDGFVNVSIERPSGGMLTVYDHLPIKDIEDWSSLPAAHIQPNQLSLGTELRIRIETVLDIPVGVAPDGSFHFDNVLLRANKVDPVPVDTDEDGIPNGQDNCPVHPNPGQEDADGDGVGDACDPTPNGPDNDADDDGILNADDNCPLNPNPGQEDADGDGAGDICDPTPNGPGSGNPDPDGDGVPTPTDNCPLISNPSQTDTDGDGIGDACDPTPNGPEGIGGVGDGQAVFDGRNLFVNLKCFGVSKKGKCFSRATIYKSKGGTRYTFPIQRVVSTNNGKVIRARIRFQFRKELEQRDSVVLKSVLRTDRNSKEKTTKFKTLELIKR